MFGVAATYVGAETGNAWLDLRLKVAGADGNTFGGTMDDYCGVIPSPLNGEGEQFPGSTCTATSAWPSTPLSSMARRCQSRRAS